MSYYLAYITDSLDIEQQIDITPIIIKTLVWNFH